MVCLSEDSSRNVFDLSQPLVLDLNLSLTDYRQILCPEFHPTPGVLEFCVCLFLGIQFDSIDQPVCYQYHIVFITFAL